MVYQFDTQLKKGKAVERKLDRFFSRQFDSIETVGMDMERVGVDRIYFKGDQRWLVEYKADFKSHKTGNFYAETVAYGKYNNNGKFEIGKAGWVWTSRADYLIYVAMLPEAEDGLGTAYIATLDDIRANMPGWELIGRSVQVKNNGFQGRGLVLPLRELERVSVRKVTII